MKRFFRALTLAIWGLIAVASSPAQAQTVEETLFFLLYGKEDRDPFDDFRMFRRQSERQWDIVAKKERGKYSFVTADDLKRADLLSWEADATIVIEPLQPCKFRLIEEIRSREVWFGPKKFEGVVDFSNWRDVSMRMEDADELKVSYTGAVKTGTLSKPRGKDGKVEEMKVDEEPFAIVALKVADRMSRAADYFRSSFCKGRAF
jgi:hypothetical protein